MNTQTQKCGYPYCGCVGQCYIKSQLAPKNCTPLDEYIAEMEKDPEIKQLLDIAREDVKKWSEQPAQEPVAWIDTKADIDEAFITNELKKAHIKRNSYCDNWNIPLYTHPAPSWQGLSDDDVHNYADHNFAFASEHFEEIFNFYRAIEQALKEKNHGV